MIIIHVRRPLSPSPLYLSLFVSCYLFAFYSNLPAILLELMFVYVYEKKKKKTSVRVLFLCASSTAAARVLRVRPAS